jgi:hypothetical protein
LARVTCRIKQYIQPFERLLAISELKALAGADPVPIGTRSDIAIDFSVEITDRPDKLEAGLAYWESIHHDGFSHTRQVRTEATVNVVRNAIPFEELRSSLPFKGRVPVPNRRCLRYGTHGIHEYRGKFFPQLVTALMNIAGAREGSVVADPMCGSGTAVVEAIATGRSALGIDKNPLSVLIASTKCALLSVKPALLIKAYHRVREQLLHSSQSLSASFGYFGSLNAHDQDYLRGWFSDQVLTDLDQIVSCIENVSPPAVRDLMRLSLSNILRRVSWQKDDDLRVRKEVRLDADIDPVKEFLDELGRSVRIVVAYLYQNSRRPVGVVNVQEGDARRSADHWRGYLGSVDVVITSPPYATALPYLDTDRLSLIYLKLLKRSDHRSRDQEMIGNREITPKIRDHYWSAFRQNKDRFPASISCLIDRIHRLNKDADVGFRRQNLSALLAKYFADMRDVLIGVQRVLKPGAPAHFVVGSNHTIAGGKHVAIETASLLLDLAESVGLTAESLQPMEMLVSRDIFRKNAGPSEYILSLRKPA